ncbi:methyltransferase family protein [Microcella putealis]|uniref:Methyltransferase family protein n=1 Tax=Microcella putealis TaxID=337005 RepID=A0A4V2EWM4_9MICO|nr:methyltransferase domain-containing protein [Microcella putealis]RZS56500.1 methyltransferase family protein [Microcella putealis]TQM27014.1 methyltransferase family protein [Microcella putealis]
MDAPNAYTSGHHESVLATHRRRTIANSAQYLEPQLTMGRTLLDVGCGPGTITIEFGARVGDANVVGVDMAEAAIAAARTHAADVGSTVRFERANATGLPFDDNSFDIVHTHQTLQHVPDPVAMLREMGRVARPGGVVAAREVDYAATTWFPELPGLAQWLELYRRVHRATSGEPDAARRLVSWARAAQLHELHLSASAWVFATPAERNWWGEAWAERALESDFARQAVDGGHAQISELRAISDAWREWTRHDDGWFSMTHGELLAAPPPG